MSLGMIAYNSAYHSTPIRPIGSKAFDMENNPAFQQMKRERYNEVYNHELAHKNAGGTYAGAIVIDKDANGVATGGHVDIQMPVMNKANPQSTINHANVVFGAAMAPHAPSDQDYKVAGKAMEIRFQAEQALQQKEQQKMNMGSNPLALGNRLNVVV